MRRWHPWAWRLIVLAALLLFPSIAFSAGRVPTGLTVWGITALVLLAAAGIALALRMPHRLLPHGSDQPSIREAYRGNIIQLVSMLLVVSGLVVGLLQLDASLDEFRSQTAGRFADQIAAAEARLNDASGSEAHRLDAISDLRRIHREHAEGRFVVERVVLRFVQRQTRIQDEMPGSPTATSSGRAPVIPEVQAALEFILEDGQQEREPDWDAALIESARGGMPLADLDLRGANLADADLTGADLSRTFLDGADLQRARLGQSIMVETSLQGAKLQGANLQGADMRGADLLDAALSRADVSGTDLSVARNLTWAQVADATIDCGTSVPPTLSENATSLEWQLPTFFVLTDCLVPTELYIAADVPTTLRVVKLATDLAHFAVVELGIDVLLPPSRVSPIGVVVHASPGKYSVTRSLTGSGFNSSSLIVVAGTSADEPARPTSGNAQNQGTPTGSAAATRVASPGASLGASPAPSPTPSPPAGASATPTSEAGPPEFTVQPTVMVGDMPNTGDRECADFSTQPEAQAFFEAAGGPTLDLHRLDRDGDGVACGAAR